jgi:hypothetical protein
MDEATAVFLTVFGLCLVAVGAIALVINMIQKPVSDVSAADRDKIRELGNYDAQFDETVVNVTTVDVITYEDDVAAIGRTAEVGKKRRGRPAGSRSRK